MNQLIFLDRSKYFLKSLKNYKNGQILFNNSFLFLPWAPSIGILMIFLSLIFSIANNYKEFRFDKYRNFIISAILIMLLSAFRQAFFYLNNNPDVSVENIFIGLGNWIPLLIGFWGFQFYLKNINNRILVARNLLIGTLPILISCMGQLWWGWDSPITIFWGLIVFFQKKLIEKASGVTGIFSNPNYLGFWLTMIWPFSLYFFFTVKKRIFKVINFSYVLTTFYFVLLSNSRNAFIGMIISSLFLIKAKFLIILLLLVLVLVIFNIIFPEMSIVFFNDFKYFTNKNLFSKFALNLKSNLLQYQRLEIWIKAKDLIISRPFLGWGASTFPIIYALFKGNSDAQHLHNIFLQVSYDYGLIASLIIFFIIYKSLFECFKYCKNNFKNNNFDFFWYMSSLVVVIFHQLDFPYFDARISIMFWTLLSGCKVMVIKSSK